MERCSVASFVEVSDTGGYDIIILGTAIWALLYIIGVRRTGETLEKKNFSEYLVDSKSCCTFAFATQKRGVPERAWRFDWLEVSDMVSGEMYDR